MISTTSIHRVVRIVVTRTKYKEGTRKLWRLMRRLIDEFITYEGYGHLHKSHIYNNPPLMSIIYRIYVSLKPYYEKSNDKKFQ